MSSLNDQKLSEIAKDLNLNLDKFRKDMDDPDIQALIQKDVQNGIAAGVTGTPTIFVNGKTVTNRSIQGFQDMINAELKK